MPVPSSWVLAVRALDPALWPPSAWPQQLFALLLLLPMFYFVPCFGSFLGQKMWDFWDGILNFSKQDHSEGHAARYVCVILHDLQLFFSTDALGRQWFKLLLMMGTFIFSLGCTGISFASLVTGWEDRLWWNNQCCNVERVGSKLCWAKDLGSAECFKAAHKILIKQSGASFCTA